MGWNFFGFRWRGSRRSMEIPVREITLKVIANGDRVVYYHLPAPYAEILRTMNCRTYWVGSTLSMDHTDDIRNADAVLQEFVRITLSRHSLYSTLIVTIPLSMIPIRERTVGDRGCPRDYEIQINFAQN